MAQAVEEVSFRAKKTTADVDLLSKVLKFEAIGTPHIQQLADGFDQLRPPLSGVLLDSQKLGDVMLGIPPALIANTEGWRRYREAIASVQTTSEKLSGKLGDVAGILNNISGTLAEVGAIAARTGQSLIKALFPKDGIPKDVFGAIISGATAAVAIVGKLWDKLTGAEAKRVTALRKDLYATAGGFEALEKRAKQAGLTLSGILDAKNVKAYTAEVEKLNKAIAFQDGALDDLAAAEEKYHLSLDSASASLFKEFKLLTAGGRSAEQVLGAMKEEWQALVKEALKFGIALPSSLKPIIQQMIDLGLITDENGKALTDISQISFTEVGQSGKTAFDRMTAAVDKLVAAIKLSLGLALSDIERQLLGLQSAFGNLPSGGTGGGNTGGGNPPPNPDNPTLTASLTAQAQSLKVKTATISAKVLPFKLPATAIKLPAAGIKVPAALFKFPTSGLKLPAAVKIPSPVVKLPGSFTLPASATAAAVPSRNDGDIVTATTTLSDGQVIARNTWRRAMDQRRNRYKSRAV
jgi:hypothetical protein